MQMYCCQMNKAILVIYSKYDDRNYYVEVERDDRLIAEILERAIWFYQVILLPELSDQTKGFPNKQFRSN